MSPETFSLIGRGLRRLEEAHVAELASTLQQALAVVHPTHRRTAGESLELFNARTLTALKNRLDQTKERVLSTIKDTRSTITREEMPQVIHVVQANLAPALYVTRFQSYEEAFARHVARFGSTMNLADYRVSISSEPGTRSPARIPSENSVTRSVTISRLRWSGSKIRDRSRIPSRRVHSSKQIAS